MRDLLSKDHKRRLKLRERPDTGVYVEVNQYIAVIFNTVICKS